jgi:AcrR family transcriptional regulator
MLYHYFGSKEGLFTAVLEAMYGSIRESQKDTSLLELSPTEAMRTLVAQTYGVILAHPEFIGLLSSENLMKARHIRASATIRDMYGPLLSVLRTILERGAANGEFRPDIDPIELYISIGGLSFHALSNQHTLKAIFSIDLISPEAIGRRLEHVTEMVMRYCEAGIGAAQSGTASTGRMAAIGN